MLIASHAVFATLEVPFIAAGWQLAVDSTFGSSNVNGITSDGSGKFLAVGSAGKAAISTDSAFTWSSVETNFGENNIFAAHYADDIFVIGGSTGRLATSSDGENWTIRESGFGASPILGITWSAANSLWVAVGGSGKLATSVDATQWVLRPSSFGTTFINDVFSVQNTIIAVGFDGKLATSNNATDWTQRTSSFVSSTIYGVTGKSNGLQYVAVGDSGKIATSVNGTSWTQVFPGTSFGGSTIRSVDGNTESYVAAGALGKLATSTLPAASWSQRQSNFGFDTINDIYLDDNIGIAVGNSGKIAYSV